MKTVSITIEVEVPDDATHAAVDMDGHVSYRSGYFGDERQPKPMNAKWNTRHHAKVTNWRETLTEVEG